MVKTDFYTALRQYLEGREVTPLVEKVGRKKVMRAADNYVLKDNQLFYTGPSRNYMRLVVLTEDQKKAVLEECHDRPGTGNHSGVRATRDRVIAGYYWSSIKEDVANWVKCCHWCRRNDPIKTEPSVLDPVKVKVKDAWEVVGMDLIGPLPETDKGNTYVFTLTDLFTKWVVAEPLQSKCAREVSAALISKLYLFGMVRKIISDQGTEFVNELNSRIFKALNIQHAVSCANHPPSNGRDKHTGQNIKHVLRKYVNNEHGDWDVHLQAVVHGINTAKQRWTQYSPFYLLFHRHPRLPEVMNACPMGESFEVQDPEDELEGRLKDIQVLNEKVLSNMERTQSQQKKRKPVRERSLEAGDDVLIGENSKKRRVGDALQDRHEGPSTPAAVSTKGVETVRKDTDKL